MIAPYSIAMKPPVEMQTAFTPDFLRLCDMKIMQNILRNWKHFNFAFGKVQC